jgi:uncharacterized protein (DUF1330 family)
MRYWRFSPAGCRPLWSAVENVVAAFVIFIRERLRAADVFQAYATEARASVSGHDPRLLAFNGKCLTLEGPETQAVFVLQFSTVEAAMAWYDSPAYVAAREKRHLSADYRILIAEGI